MKKTSAMVLALIPSILFCSCNISTDDGNQQTPAMISQDTQATKTDQITQTTQTVQITEATTQPNAEIIELAEYDINKVVFQSYVKYNGLDFLSEEQQRIFRLSDFVYTAFDIDQSEFFRASGMKVPTVGIEDTVFFHTGFTYESVLNGFLSVLSEEIVSGLIDQKCADINDEFVCGTGARGINASFMGTVEFEPVEITDDIVKFKALAGYGDANADTDKITSYEEFNFEMQKIDGKWIVTKFEMWM